VLNASTAAITAVAFANLRSDLLAFGDAEGELWLVELQPAAPALRKVGQPRASLQPDVRAAPCTASGWAAASPTLGAAAVGKVDGPFGE